MSLLKLADFNSLLISHSEQFLGGYVRLPWNPIYQETEIPPENFVLRDQFGNYVPAQVFQVDKLDSSHNFLLISLKNTSAEFENLSKVLGSLTIEKSKPATQNSGFPRLEIILGPNDCPRGVKLANGQLNIWFNLIPAPEDNENDWNWYSGSATSVLRGNQEMLEPFKAADTGTAREPHWMGHDPQQRCMQVDKIQVWDNTCNIWSEPYNPSYQAYNLISYSIGSVGVSITIASTPLSYNNAGEIGKCQLYRIISLFKDTDYVLEELFVRKENINSEVSEKDDYLEFKAHYFTFMNLSFFPIPLEHESHRAFVITSCTPSLVGSYTPSYPAYGFFSSVVLEQLAENPDKVIEQPTKDFPEWPNKYRTFSWGLSRCQSTKCLHRFTFGEMLPNFYSVLPSFSIGTNNPQILPW